MATAQTTEDARIDELLGQVERLYRTLTGSEPRAAGDSPESQIPPEKDPGQYVEMQLERLLAALGGQPVDAAATPSWMPALSAAESGKEICIQVDLPGVRREDVRLSTTGRTLEVSGERRHNGEGVLRLSERPQGVFRRSLQLPPDALTDQVSAQMIDGVLTIRVGRAAQQTAPRRVNVD